MDSYKPIKFFLRIGDKSIRDIGDLYNNFHIDKLYELYQAGILQRWLTVHGIEDKAHSLAEFEKVYHKDDIDDERARAFCNIFFPGYLPDELESLIQNFKINKKWKEEIELLSENQEKYFNYIQNYHIGYKELKQSIIENALNMPAIRAHIEYLSREYLELFKLDCSACIDLFSEKTPIALLIMFANESIRNFIDTRPVLREKALNVINENTPLNHEDLSGKKLAPFIFPRESDIGKVISYIRVCSKSTKGNWEEIESDRNKKFMILYNNSAFVSVRPYNDPDNELPREITGLPIIHGIEYKNYASYLAYMEV